MHDLPAEWLALATAAGDHAWPGFLILLAVLAALAGGATARLLPRSTVRQHSDPQPASRFREKLGAGVVAGFILVLVTGMLFALVAAQLGDGRRLQQLDEHFSASVGTHTPAWAIAAMGVLTHFGEPLVLTVLGLAVAAALWRHGHRGLALGWACALVGNTVLNLSLKQVFARARPLIDGLPGPASGYSFPSGHSSASMVAYGMLAYLAWRLLPRRWHAAASMAAVAVVWTTACSRVFLQVHFASDVLAGLCSGLAWLSICIASVEHARHRQRRRRR